MKIRAASLAAFLILTSARAAVPLPAPTIIPGGYDPGRQPDGNSLILEGPAGLTVFDTGRHPDHQQQILDTARSLGKPIVAIVNSHWHLDHSGGNQEIRAVFPAARIYASDAVADALKTFFARNAARREARLADPSIPESEKEDTRLDAAAIADTRDLLPDVPVRSDMTIRPGGRAIQLHLVRYAATKGDVWAYDPSSRTLAAGDLVVLPAPFFDTACPEGWRSALDRLARVPFRTLVPGHGSAMSPSQFRLYRKAFDRLIACSESDASKQACIAGWTSDAASFLDGERDRRSAEELLDYYFDNDLRSPAKLAELCEAKPLRRLRYGK